MTTQQELKYSFKVTYFTRKYRERKSLESCTFSTRKSSPDDAIERMMSFFKGKEIVDIKVEQPCLADKIILPPQHKDWANPRIFVALSSKEPIRKVVIHKPNGKKICINSPVQKLNKAELKELLLLLEKA